MTETIFTVFFLGIPAAFTVYFLAIMIKDKM